jgi:putative ABC transport system ATP-binding protein
MPERPKWVNLIDMPNALISLTDVQFQWPKQPPILNIQRLAIQSGSRVLLRGASGSGKTTLLSVLAGILRPQRGQVEINQVALNILSAKERDAFRGAHIGYIFQQFNLLPYLSVLDNVLLPLRLNQERARDIQSPEKEARRLMEALGVSTDITKREVNKLSIGEQQRVAVARAIIGRPSVILADEPTSALDHDSRMAFLELLLHECYIHGITLLFASHDLQLSQFFDYTLALTDISRPNAANVESMNR